MKKITAEFKTLSDIRKLKTIMKNVYSSKSDHLPDIGRFRLNKIFTPESVERAEIHITTSVGVDIVTITKPFLTFFAGEFPFERVSNLSEEEGKYTILPWNLDTRVGQDDLKNLINRIKENTKNLKYIIFIRTGRELVPSVSSIAGLNLSEIMAEDETEDLLRQIAESELRLKELNDALTQSMREVDMQKQLVIQKQNEINNLSATLATARNEATTQRQTIIQKQSEISKLSAALALAQNEVATQKQLVIQKQNEVDNLNAVVNNLNATLALAQNEAAMQRQAVIQKQTEASNEASNFATQLNYKQQEINALNNRVTELNNKVTPLSKNKVTQDLRKKNRFRFDFGGESVTPLSKNKVTQDLRKKNRPRFVFGSES